jgi:hypothetical protein
MEKGKNYPCPHCERILQNPQALKMHIRWKHSEDKNNILPIEKNSEIASTEEGTLSPSSDVPEEEKEELNFNNFYVPSSPSEIIGYCDNCNNPVRENQNKCSNCSEVFD